jgi:hypothetical protein
MTRSRRRLSERQVNIIAESFEMHPALVADDLGVIFSWQEPADELVVWLSARHRWRAECAVSYLTAIHYALPALTDRS